MSGREDYTNPCGAPRDDLTSIRCHLTHGHEGDHEGYTVITWENEGGATA